jgi:Zn-finger domain-containing protein
VNYEKEIRKEYGPDARIEFMQFHRSRPSIINDKHVQTALSLGYVKLAEDKSIAIMDSVLRQYLKNPEKIKIYNEALEKSRRNSLKMGDFEDQMTLQRELMDEELQKKGLVDGKGKLDQEVEADLKLKEKIDKCLLLNIPRTLITWDIIKYYLTTSYDHRTKYSGSFPNLRPYLDTNQMKSFENFHKQAINILKNHLNENIPYISDISSLLTGKFEIEKKIKGLHVKTNPSAVGAAILNSVGDIDLDEAAQIFGLNPEEVKTERDKIETFQKPSSRAQQFLEMIK